MTVQTAYEDALALLPSNTTEDNSLNRYAVQWVNLALMELLDTENSIRRYNGTSELDFAPILHNLTDNIPYSGKLGGAIIYFIASLCAKDDEDAYWAQDYRARCIAIANSCLKAVPEMIEDVYDGDE